MSEMLSWLRTSDQSQPGTSGVGQLRRVLVVLELVLVLTAVACSDGSTSKSASAAPATVPPASNGGSTQAASGTPASAPAGSAAGTPDGPFCSLRNVANPAVDYDNPDPTAAVESLQKAVLLAPPEIKLAVETIADAEIPIFQGRVPANQIDQRVGDPKVLKATRDIATWSAAHCR